jgi:hypothetical protein
VEPAAQHLLLVVQVAAELAEHLPHRVRSILVLAVVVALVSLVLAEQADREL